MVIQHWIPSPPSSVMMHLICPAVWMRSGTTPTTPSLASLPHLFLRPPSSPLSPSSISRLSIPLSLLLSLPPPPLFLLSLFSLSPHSLLPTLPLPPLPISLSPTPLHISCVMTRDRGGRRRGKRFGGGGGGGGGGWSSWVAEKQVVVYRNTLFSSCIKMVHKIAWPSPLHLAASWYSMTWTVDIFCVPLKIYFKRAYIRRGDFSLIFIFIYVFNCYITVFCTICK